jgi:osmoprotectant transport system substrate-binding protein
MRTALARRGALLSVAFAAVMLVTAACGNDSSPSSSPSGGGAKGKITVGSAEFGESEIIASMYSQALKKAGYDVGEKFKIGSREVYIKAIENGEIDVVPEYIGTLTEFFNAQFNGPDAPNTKPLATTDVDKTYQAAKELVARKNLTVLTPSKAADQNAFAVTKNFADKNGLTKPKLSDLTKLNGQLTLGAGPECEKRRFCLIGLQQVYGLRFKDVKKLDSGGPKTIAALKDGSIDVGLVFSSDGAVAAENLVVLDDDKKLQTTDNITALVRNSVPQEARDTLDKVDQALTTEKLQELNKKFSVDKEDAKDLAEQFLKDAHLI